MHRFLLKLIVSCSLIAWVFLSQIDLQDLFVVLVGVDLRLLSLAFMLHLFGYLFSALRWQKILASQQVHVKLLPLIDSYLVATFFNLFMPTRIGGDVSRVSDLRRASETLSKSASSVFAERLLGIFVLLVFALTASLIRLPLALKIPAIWLGLVFGLGGLVGIICLLYSQFISRLMLLIPVPRVRHKFIAEWQTFREHVILVFAQRKPLAWGIWYSFLLQTNVVVHFWIIGEALGFNIPMLDYFFLVPIQLLILMLPSINGIGLREASSIILFGYYGIAATEAATFGFVDLAMILFLGLIGWFRFLIRRSIPYSSESIPRTAPE